MLPTVRHCELGPHGDGTQGSPLGLACSGGATREFIQFSVRLTKEGRRGDRGERFDGIIGMGCLIEKIFSFWRQI